MVAAGCKWFGKRLDTCLTNQQIKIENCLFQQNVSGNGGGLMVVHYSNSPVVENDMTKRTCSHGENIIELHGITKQYPGVTALSDVDFSLRRGEIHALVGENGAGKSSLIKILSGDTEPTLGEIRINGETAVVGRPQDARDAGVVTVFQELTVIPSLTVAENVVLGNLPMAGPGNAIFSRGQARKIANDIFNRLTFRICLNCISTN